MEKMIQRNSCGFVGRLLSSSRMNREGCGCHSREPGQRKQQGQKSMRQCLRRSVGLGAVGREAEVPRTEAKGKRGSRGGDTGEQIWKNFVGLTFIPHKLGCHH